MLAACLTSSLVPFSPSSPPPFTSSPLLFMFLSSLTYLSSLHKHTPPPPPASDQPEWCSDLACLPWVKIKKIKNLPQFDDIIAATHVQPTCSKPWVETTALNCCECESVVKSECQILPLLVSMRVQLHAAAREVVLTMVLFRQENRNIHTHSPNTAATHSVMTFITGTLNECTTTTDMTVLLLLWLLNWGNELLYIIITQQRKDKD